MLSIITKNGRGPGKVVKGAVGDARKYCGCGTHDEAEGNPADRSRVQLPQQADFWRSHDEAGKGERTGSGGDLNQERRWE